MELTIFEDESIHSYFIRILLCKGHINGNGVFNGLVSPSGSLAILPNLKGRLTSCFNYISDDSFRILLAEHTVFNDLRYFDLEELKNYMLLGEEPTDYGDGLHKIYGGKTQLRYCPDCFKNQIQNHGICWFRLDWLCSLSCKIHNSSLYHVHKRLTRCCNRTSNITQNMLSAMSGKCTYCGENVWSEPEKILIGDFNRSQYILFPEKAEVSPHRPSGNV
ncbi:hypothetical protein VXJ15_002107 [Vibrio vulnificus]|nr:hypothetical protein [Vibrio vulnificus]